MKPCSFSLIAASVAGFFLAPMSARADSIYSAERFDMLDKAGVFTPAFKDAVHDLVDSKQAIVDARKEEKDLTAQLPDLQKQADEAEKKVAALRVQLAEYDHSDDSDFTQLQKKMSDTHAKPEEQSVLAQAFLWAYPYSPHQTDAQQYLQQAQKTLADRAQAEKDAEAARVAARAKLIQRAQARDLSLAEWRDFLLNMSEEDLVNYLGQPAVHGDGYWIYSGDWTLDTTTQQKVGLRINLNGARVISVDEVPH